MILIWISPVYILKIISPESSFTLFSHVLGLPSDCFPRNFSTKCIFALNWVFLHPCYPLFSYIYWTSLLNFIRVIAVFELLTNVMVINTV